MKHSKEQPDSAFSEYCHEHQVIPVKQDQVVLSQLSKDKPKGINLNHEDIYAPIMFIYSDSKDEFFTDGQKNIARDLRLGKYKIIASIDLHHNTQAIALDRVEHFIMNHTTVGNTCLKIIHGRGLNSPNNNGILKHMVRRYLEQHPRILAYSKSGINVGGDGATLVKLKN